MTASLLHEKEPDFVSLIAEQHNSASIPADSWMGLDGSGAAHSRRCMAWKRREDWTLGLLIATVLAVTRRFAQVAGWSGKRAKAALRRGAAPRARRDAAHRHQGDYDVRLLNAGGSLSRPRRLVFLENVTH